MVKPVEVAKNESAVVKTEESKSKTEAIEEGNDVNVTSWSPFFPCDKVSGFQIRTRSCKVSQCKEKLVDAQLCKEAEKGEKKQY